LKNNNRPNAAAGATICGGACILKAGESAFGGKRAGKPEGGAAADATAMPPSAGTKPRQQRQSKAVKADGRAVSRLGRAVRR